MTTLLYAAIWLSVAMAIRIAVGPAGSWWTADTLAPEDLTRLPTTVINLSLFIGFLWVLAAMGLKSSPGPVVRAVWLIPIYLSAVGICGLWWDVRLLMALYPLLMPLVLSALFPARLSSTVTGQAP